MIRPYLANKLHRTFVDRYLLGEDLRAYLEPWAFGRLNALERVLLARRVPEVRGSIARLIGDAVALAAPDPERDARLVNTLLGAAGLEGGGIGGEAVDALDATLGYSDSEQAARLSSADFVAIDESELRDAPLAAAAMPMAPKAPTSSAASGELTRGGVPGGFGGGGRAAREEADVRERERAAALFRGADRTESGPRPRTFARGSRTPRRS